MTSTSSASGSTATVTVDVWIRPLDSVIGIRKELSLERFLTQRPAGFEVAKGLVYLQGVVIDIDDATGRARSIERVREHLPGT